MRRRITKEFSWNGSAWAQTNEIHYVYDGNLVVQERDANNLPTVTYTRGNDLSGTLQGAGGIGGLLARTDNSKQLLSDSLATAFYHADGNGNITALIYTNQVMAAKYLYDPYGNMLSMYGSLADANSYRFSSKEWNANSGLYYYLYRFYDPNLQRWLNRDPLWESGFENVRDRIPMRLRQFMPHSELLQGPNLYSFVLNNPIDYADIYGLLGGAWNNPPGPSGPPSGSGRKACSDLCPGKHNWQVEGDDSAEDCVEKFMAGLGLYDGGLGAGGGIIGGINPVTGPPIGIGLGLGFFGQLVIADNFCGGCSK
jgi:RHS repeat-associated protein